MTGPRCSPYDCLTYVLRPADHRPALLRKPRDGSFSSIVCATRQSQRSADQRCTRWLRLWRSWHCAQLRWCEVYTDRRNRSDTTRSLPRRRSSIGSRVTNSRRRTNTLLWPDTGGNWSVGRQASQSSCLLTGPRASC